MGVVIFACSMVCRYNPLVLMKPMTERQPQTFSQSKTNNIPADIPADIPANLLGSTINSNLLISNSESNLNSEAKLTATIYANNSNGTVDENAIGVNQLSHSKEVNLMKNLGVRFARVDASLEASVNSQPVYNCQTGTWSPVSLAHRVKLAQRAGAQVELIIDYSPKCLEPQINGNEPLSNYYPPDIGSNLSKWMSLISQVGNWAILHGVRYFEVWNEPDWTFFSGTVEQYSHLYKNTVTPLESDAKKLHAKIFVGGPAIADVLGQIDSTFLKAFLGYISSYKLPLNFLSWHTYADDPNAGTASFLPSGLCLTNHVVHIGVPCYWTPSMNTDVYSNEAQSVKSILKQYKAYHPQLWIDEWNLDAESDQRQNTSYASSFLLSAVAKATSAGVNVMEWYNTADYPPGQYQGFGLLNQSLKPKPSYLGFMIWHLMSGTKLRIAAVIKKSDIYQHPSLLASRNSQGILNILVNNYVSYDTSGNFGSSPTKFNLLNCNFRVEALVPNSQYRVEFRTIPLGQPNSFSISTQKVTTDSSGSFKFNIKEEEESSTLVSFSLIKTASSSSNYLSLYLAGTFVILIILTLIILRIKKGSKAGTASARAKLAKD